MSIPLKPELYGLSEDEAVFFKSQTGIEGDEELKNHILTVQAEAYKIRAYPCIRMFTFLRLGISRHPSYQRFLAIGREREGAIYLEIGCCFGNDARKTVADGFPVHQVIATDLHSEFWSLGHKLFKSTPDSFPARFIAADMLYLKDSSEDGTYTAISEVQSLDQLRGSVAAIHAAAFFHLFDEEQQLQATAKSLSLGAASTRSMFCHSPETWRSMWDGGIFPKDAIDVEVTLKEFDRPDVPGAKICILVWCITVH
ncbi:hypothetical protein F5146DRAFT_1120396 [Armillaria mellea]|nr:hypothetical protein F5146DRAFT_1120396 [Armillaria mellea]